VSKKKVSKPKAQRSKGVEGQSKKVKSSEGVLPQWLYDQSNKLLIIFGLACGIYANSLFNDYALDDAIVITDNMFTQKGFDGVGDHFTNELFYGFFKDESKASLVAGGRYRPLSVAMFAAEHGLFGKSIPWVGHLMNVLLYGLTGIILFLVLNYLFKNFKNENLSILLPFVATILYVTHPIHTEVVANVKGRDEILALLGALSSMYFILKAHADKNLKYLALGTFIFFLALLSKENAVTFLAVIPIALYFFRDASFEDLLKHTIPLIGSVAVFFGIRSSVLPDSPIFGERSRELMNNPFLKIEGNQYVDFTKSEEIATVIYTWGEYIKLLIFPHPLSHDYYPRQYDVMTFGDIGVLFWVVVFAALGLLSIWSLKSKSIWGFCAIVFFSTFSIVSNLLFPIGTWISERFMYMASIGFCLALAYGLVLGADYLKKKNILSIAPHKSILIATAIIAGLYSIKTVLRNPVWKNNYTLFTTDVETSTRSAKLQNAAGGVKIEEAYDIQNVNQKNQLLNEAVGHLNQAIEIHPTYKSPFLLRGNANNNLKNYDAAIADYGSALRLDPGYAEAQRNLVVTYTQAGKYFGEEKGDINKAANYLQKALELEPRNYEVNRLLGVCFGVAGDHNRAISYFTTATQIKPEDASSWVNLSKAYFYTNDTEKQNQYRQKALSIDPNAFNVQ